MKMSSYHWTDYHSRYLLEFLLGNKASEFRQQHELKKFLLLPLRALFFIDYRLHWRQRT